MELTPTRSKTDGGDVVFAIGIGSQTQNKVAVGEDFKSVFENGDEIRLYAVNHTSGVTGTLAASGNCIR